MWDVLARAAVLLIILPIHEAAHAFAAEKLGDPTPRGMGRLTLNPLKHLDVLGSMMLLVMGFGWAKPVPVDPRNFRHPRRDMAIVAAAGPLSNIALAFMAVAAMKLVFYTTGLHPQTDALPGILRLIMRISVVLAVFNLLPIPPLDGSRILGLFLPGAMYYFVMRYERIMMFALLALMWLGYLRGPIGFLTGHAEAFLYKITEPIDYLFLLLR
ncbi:MAG: site-2 protease family protein [Oscillospiraceae bacterium]|nr:site-2 protease family protein [Oscillospiraceae bacterium]